MAEWSKFIATKITNLKTLNGRGLKIGWKLDFNLIKAWELRIGRSVVHGFLKLFLGVQAVERF